VAKKAAAAAKSTPDSTKQLIDAIIAVKRLQDFIREHGGLEKSLEAVGRVRELMELTGGFDTLRQALETVGKENAPQ
jgi:hypothetical protein